jgi:AraC family transcriptional regulator of adaptative response/methylated-DNA-[protein]-cysteine methyltransferase
MTFHAWQRARILGAAAGGLSAGGTVGEAAAASGYGSFSGFGAAFKKITGSTPRGASPCLLADRIATPLGPMVAIADDAGLWLLEFEDRRALPRELAWVSRRAGAAVVPGRNAVLRQLARELEAWFAGRSLAFATPLHVEGSAFQTQVWRELRRIPPGTTRSYAEVAAAVGAPAAVRAVGRANGENRLAIVVPCHRVIRADGTLCGYGGGLWRKRWLLEHEAGAHLASAGLSP